MKKSFELNPPDDKDLTRDVFAEREHVLEDEYFRKRDRELISQMHDTARSEEERRRMGTALGISDETSLLELQKVGYNVDTIQLLHLVPFIAVAWAEGRVSHSERDLIMQAAELRGVTYESLAYRQLESWLNRRPSDEFFSVSFRAIRAVFATLRPMAQEVATRTLLDYCTAVARATSELYGLGPKISRQERELIDRITEALTPAQRESGRRTVEET
jgi:hypothetical protein